MFCRQNWHGRTRMARRKRKHIPLTEKLAAALACLLPQKHRDLWRGSKVSAEFVLAQFEWDHIVLHAHDGSDDWHNLDPKLKAVHREKSRRDTSVVAKVKRLRAAPVVAAGKPKPVVGSQARVDGKLAIGRPRRAWGRPGWRKKFNGDVVRV
jgi:hypothetical protein